MASVRILTVAQPRSREAAKPRSRAKRVSRVFGENKPRARYSQRDLAVRISSKQMVAPGSIPRKARTVLGIVTRPREVTVAVQSGLNAVIEHTPDRQSPTGCLRYRRMIRR